MNAAKLFVSCAVVLIIAIAIPPLSIAIGEDDQIESEQRESFDAWAERTKKNLDKYLNAPLYTIALEVSNISEYRITNENHVKFVLRPSQEGITTVRWTSRTLREAQDFIQLVKKGAVRSATVQNGQILEILLRDKIIQ